MHPLDVAFRLVSRARRGVVLCYHTLRAEELREQVELFGRWFDFIHHDERLTEPLVRDIDGQLKPASWDDALDRVAKGLHAVRDRHGNDSLAFISSSRCTVEENYLMQKMARAAFGTHNIHQCAAT